MIKLNLDKTQYKQKPQGIEIAALRNRLCNAGAIVEIEPAELMKAIERGQTFTPAVMTGTTGDTWQGQQIICVDIDNKNNAGEMIKNPLLPETAIKHLSIYGICPYFIYYSFSNTDTWPRYRIVFILNEALTDKNEMIQLTERVTGALNLIAPGCADPTAKDAARMYYGSTQNSICYVNEAITDIEKLRAMPHFETHPVKATEPKKQKNISATDEDFERDKNNFNLLEYILRTEPGTTTRKAGHAIFINPCPLCGHNDDFTLNDEKIHLYKDHGANGGTGGTIIDYLMARHNLSNGEAIRMFKYEIMNYPQPIAETTTETTDYLTAFNNKIHTRAFEPIKTGVNFFDNLLGGGILRQSLLLLLAAPGIGKTTLAQQIAEALAAQKQPIIYIALEMSREQMLAKIFSARLANTKTPMTAAQILQAYNWTAAEETAFNNVFEAYKEQVFPYLKYTTGADLGETSLTAIMEHITAKAEAAHAAGEPAPAVFVDYLHLIEKIKGDNGEIAETIKESLRQFKNNYAVPYNTFVFAIGATNRTDAKDNNVNLYSGRDTSGIEYTGDFVITLNEAKEQTGPKDTRTTELFLAKGRLVNRSEKPKIIYLHGENSYFSDEFIPGTTNRKRAI